MILVASPDKPFEYTPKGTLRRQNVLRNYAQEIEAIYVSVKESTQVNLKGPKDWTRHSALEFTRDVLERTMKKGTGKINDDMDLFEHGLDRHVELIYRRR